MRLRVARPLCARTYVRTYLALRARQVSRALASLSLVVRARALFAQLSAALLVAKAMAIFLFEVHVELAGYWVAGPWLTSCRSARDACMSALDPGIRFRFLDDVIIQEREICHPICSRHASPEEISLNRWQLLQRRLKWVRRHSPDGSTVHGLLTGLHACGLSPPMSSVWVAALSFGFQLRMGADWPPMAVHFLQLRWWEKYSRSTWRSNIIDEYEDECLVDPTFFAFARRIVELAANSELEGPPPVPVRIARCLARSEARRSV